MAAPRVESSALKRLPSMVQSSPSGGWFGPVAPSGTGSTTSGTKPGASA